MTHDPWYYSQRTHDIPEISTLLRRHLRRILDVRIEPRDPSRPEIQIRHVGRVAVVLVWVHVQRGRLAQSLQRMEHPDGADRRRADVLVLERMIHQQRAVNLVRPVERRHVEVDVLGVEETAALTLETEGRQR